MSSESGRARSAWRGEPLEIAYDVFGPETGQPLVLVMGIGAQRIFWDAELVARFVAAGFRVVRFDHRELGESTRLPRSAPVPRPLPLLARRLVGAHIDAPYTLSDMGGDVVAILDALGWPSAHVVGVSLGGMIAQHLAIEHRDRVRSITAIMTTPGSRRYLPKPAAFRALVLQKPPTTAAEAGASVERLFHLIGGSGYPLDGARLRAIGEAAFVRGSSPRGFLRHFAAVLASGDRSRALPGVTTPALVIHGDEDPMFPLAAGKKLAALIPGAEFLPVAGMGHALPPALWPMFVDRIAALAARAR